MEKIQNHFGEAKIIEHVGNYGDIISRSISKSYIDEDGDIQSYSTQVFNIKLKDGSLAVGDWFDIYECDCYGNCIIGYSRTRLELAQLWDTLPSYRSGYSLALQYKYRYGAINSNGVLAVQPIYDRLTFNNEVSYIAYHNGSLGYVDSFDGHHITPILFPHAQPFFEHKAAVEYNGKMGYVSRKKTIKNPNNNEEYAIAPKYDTAGDFENGYAEVSKDGEFFLIDENGNRYAKENKILQRLN